MIHEKIAAIRKAKGLKAIHVAKEAHLNRSVYSKIENGNRKISVQELMDIARAMDVPVVEFFDDPKKVSVPSIILKDPEAGRALSSLIDSGIFEDAKGRRALSAIVDFFTDE